MNIVADLLLGIAAVIHLLPAVGVLGTPRLERLYGIGVTGPDLAILMRHRAVLLGLLGVLLFAAIWDDELRPAAMAGGLVSDIAFLAITASHRGFNAEMRRVVLADVVSVVALVAAAVVIAVG